MMTERNLSKADKAAIRQITTGELTQVDLDRWKKAILVTQQNDSRAAAGKPVPIARYISVYRHNADWRRALDAEFGNTSAVVRTAAYRKYEPGPTPPSEKSPQTNLPHINELKRQLKASINRSKKQYG